MQLQNPEFVLELSDDWKQSPTSDPEQFTFGSAEKGASLVISVMLANIPRLRLIEVARQLIAEREQAEQAVAGRKITFGDKWVQPDVTGDLAEVAYAGYDDQGNIFRFMGFVTEAKVVSFWCSVCTSDNEFSKRVFDETYRGFRFYVP
jgi:hypothetical protein